MYTVLIKHVQFMERGVLMLEIILSTSIDKPIYEQIVSQVKQAIMNGTLKAGDTLPSMRKLAKDLHVSVITTQKAYEMLQRDGFIETIPAKGTFVSNSNKDFILEENRRRIETLLQEAAHLSKENGISYDEMRKILEIFYMEG